MTRITRNRIAIKVYCNYTVVSDVGVNISISMNEDGIHNQTLKRSFLCIKSKPSNVVFDNLQENTTYFSYISWTSNNKLIECTRATLPTFTTNSDGKADFVCV